jgi:hypothetical protein
VTNPGTDDRQTISILASTLIVERLVNLMAFMITLRLI